MTNPSEKLLVTLKDSIKRITINRPERRNSVDGETVQLLRDAVQHSVDDGTRVVILTGAGEKIFVAGADITEFPGATRELAIDVLRSEGFATGRYSTAYRQPMA